MTQHHILEDFTLQQHHSEYVESQTFCWMVTVLKCFMLSLSE